MPPERCGANNLGDGQNKEYLKIQCSSGRPNLCAEKDSEQTVQIVHWCEREFVLVKSNTPWNKARRIHNVHNYSTPALASA